MEKWPPIAVVTVSALKASWSANPFLAHPVQKQEHLGNDLPFNHAQKIILIKEDTTPLTHAAPTTQHSFALRTRFRRHQCAHPVPLGRLAHAIPCALSLVAVPLADEQLRGRPPLAAT
ncbi:hypothetical protein EJ03DRAFT_75372 [Teratosphaeria nubilosa]|uniref:Uncharacterized protein n=1 Tax=Teratosphaeria nubilosa TaxID=161662 RepID=A0A6G1LNR1_9PEZI|nr:hypothetical protein EJ03DRAFT_75372 [Teratosphaeria nubilosa]